MKKQISAVVVAGMLTIPVVNADVAGFEVGAYQWTPDYKGTMLLDTDDNTVPTLIDLNQDLGFTDDNNSVIWASLEHPIPILPNFKLTSSNLKSSASRILDRDGGLTFGGVTFATGSTLNSVIDTSNTEYTFYYEILDNWINLDLGLTIREYDGLVSIETTDSLLSESEVFDESIPLIYAKGRIDLPFTGFFIDASINAISADDDSLSDLTVALGYESDLGLGASLGYRTFDFDVISDDLLIDMKFDGMYISGFFHF